MFGKWRVCYDHQSAIYKCLLHPFDYFLIKPVWCNNYFHCAAQHHGPLLPNPGSCHLITLSSITDFSDSIHCVASFRPTHKWSTAYSKTTSPTVFVYKKMTITYPWGGGMEFVWQQDCFLRSSANCIYFRFLPDILGNKIFIMLLALRFHMWHVLNISLNIKWVTP